MTIDVVLHRDGWCGASYTNALADRKRTAITRLYEQFTVRIGHGIGQVVAFEFAPDDLAGGLPGIEMLETEMFGSDGDRNLPHRLVRQLHFA